MIWPVQKFMRDSFQELGLCQWDNIFSELFCFLQKQNDYLPFLKLDKILETKSHFSYKMVAGYYFPYFSHISYCSY